MNYAVLRFEKVKSLKDLGGRSGHNRRVGDVGDLPKHIDQSRLNSNILLLNAVEEFGKKTAGRRLRKNGVIAVEAVMSFSHGADVGPVTKWAQGSIDWLRREFGGDNILEISLHLDEKTPHLHVMFLPIDKRGKFNWRGLVPGRAGMTRLQSSYAEAMAPFGLIRGIPHRGRDHVPPAVHRALEKVKSEVKSLKRDVMTYFGEKEFEGFASWLHKRHEKTRMEAEATEEAKRKQKALKKAKALEDLGLGSL